MTHLHRPLRLLLLWISLAAAPTHQSVSAKTPEIVEFRSDSLNLKGALFRPEGTGPFPIIIYAHGNEPDPTHLFAAIGPELSDRGYAVLGPHRRGSGLSAGQAPNLLETLTAIEKREGVEARARAAMAALEGPQLRDIVAAICFARRLPFVDTDRVYLMGNSFGGVLVMLAAERRLGIRAGANFAGAAINWNRSPIYRSRLSRAAARARFPLFLAQAQNDFNLSPTSELAGIMARRRKPHRSKIFPAFGDSSEEAHGFGIYGSRIWAADVLAFFEAAPRNARAAQCGAAH